MINDEPAVPRLVAIDRRQLLLRTVDVEKLVDDEHSVRAIWELIRRLDLRLYHAQIAAVEGSAGREYTDPQLSISFWLYAYSRGISSAHELARQCEYEPGCQWLCGLQPVSHRTLSGFRSDNQLALIPFGACVEIDLIAEVADCPVWPCMRCKPQLKPTSLRITRTTSFSSKLQAEFEHPSRK